ncbi:MAG: OmpA family protein [Desulfuromonadales bacterium]
MFNRDGSQVVFGHMATRPGGGRVMVTALSTDGGNTWPAASTGVVGTFAGAFPDDKEFLAVGPDVNNLAQDRYVMAFHRNNFIQVSTSTDGINWTAPIQISDAGNAIDSIPAVGPRGEIFVVWEEFGTTGVSNIMFDVSLDGGTTWRNGPPANGDILVYTGNVNIFRDQFGGGLGLDGIDEGSSPPGMGEYEIPAQPNRGIWMGLSIDVDLSGGPNHGRIYVSFVDQRDRDGNPDAANAVDHHDTEIFLIASDDNGANWIALGANPVRVSHDAPASNSQFFPWMDVDQRTGHVGVAWYDARNDLGAGPGPGDTNGTANDDVQLWATVSFDGGQTFAPNVQISDGTSNGARVGPRNFLEYNGLVFFEDAFHMVWADNSNSTGDNPDGTTRNDVYYDRIFLNAVALAGVERAVLTGRDIRADQFTGEVIFLGGVPDWVSQGPGPLNGGQVSNILNQPVTGAVQAVAVDPSELIRVYVGTVGGGVWRNADRMVNFLLDSDNVLDPADPVLLARNQAILDEFIGYMNDHPNLTVTLLGHASTEGTIEYNIDLGNRRANSINGYLTANGLDAARITVPVPSPGESQILALPGDNPLNRRVELIVNHWDPLTDFLPSLSISALAIDPSDSDIIYAGTGVTSSGQAGFPNRPVEIGLLKSTDGGETWQLLNRPLFSGQTITDIEITAAGVLLVSTNGGGGAGAGAGLFRSTDGGVIFTDVSVSTGGVFPAAPVTSVVVDPGDNTRFYAGVPGQGVFTSADSGVSWAQVNGMGANQLTNLANVSRILLAISGANDSTSGQRPVYAALIAPIQSATTAAIPGGGAATTFQVPAGTLLEPGDTFVINDGVHPSEVHTVGQVAAAVGGTQVITLAGAQTFANPQNMGAQVTVNGLRLDNVFRSGDLGANWNVLPRPGTVEANGFVGIHAGAQGGIHGSIAADPLNANVVYVGGDTHNALPNVTGATNFTGRLFRFNPATGTWNHITDTGATGGGAPHADSRALVFQGQHLLEADDGGIYRLRTPGVAGRTWESLNHDLILTELYDVAYDGVNDRILGGNQDTGVGHQSATNSVIWNSLLQADGGFVEVSGTTHYFNNQFLGGFGPAPALVNAAGPGSGAAANNILVVPLGSPIQMGDQLNLPGETIFHNVAATAVVGGNLQVTLTNNLTSLHPAGQPVLVDLLQTSTIPGQNGLTVNGTGGNSIFQIETGTVQFINPFVVNTVNGNNLLIGTRFIYESTNNGRLLTLLNGPPAPTGGGGFATPQGANVGLVNSLVYGGRQPNNANGFTNHVDVIWVGTNPAPVPVPGNPASVPTALNAHALWVRQAGAGVGSNLTAVTSFTTAAGAGVAVRDVAVDPNDWRNVYVLDAQGRVWFSDTLQGPGATAVETTWTWTNFTGNLPVLTGADNLQRIEVDIVFNERVILVGGETGVFRRIGAGRWSEYGAGLPNALVTAVERVDNPPDDLLLVGTLGRGAWTLPDASLSLDVPGQLVLRGSGDNNVFELVRNAARPWLLDVYTHLDTEARPAAPDIQVGFNSLDTIRILGLGGDDQLIVDVAEGAIDVAGPITFVGGAGNDTVEVNDTGGGATVLDDLGADATGPTSGSHILTARDGFGEVGSQLVVWIETENSADGILVAQNVDVIQPGLILLAEALQNGLGPAVQGRNIAGINPISLVNALNGQLVETIRPKDDPFVTLSQVVPQGQVQLDNITSVLLRIFEEGGLDLQQVGTSGSIDDPTALRQALDDLDGTPGNVSLDTTTDRDGDGTPDISFDMQIVGKELDGIIGLAVKADVRGGAGRVELNGAMEVTATVDLDIGFGVDGKGFFIVVTSLGDSAVRVRDIQVTGEVSGSGRLGFLGVDIKAGTLALDPEVSIEFDLLDPATQAADSTIRLPELEADDFTTLISATVNGDPGDDLNDDVVLTGTFGVSLLLPGFEDDLGLVDADLTMKWSDVQEVEQASISASSAGGRALSDFLRVNPQDVLDQLEVLKDQLSLFDVDIPFLERGVGELTNLANLFQSEVLDPLKNPQSGEVQFQTLQEIVVELAANTTTDLNNMNLSLDAAAEELIFHLVLDGDVAGSCPLEFTSEVLEQAGDVAEGFSGLEFSTDVDLTGSVDFGFDLGVDLAGVNTGADPLDWFFLRDPEASGNIDFSATDFDASANYGFLSIGIVGGDVSANVAVDILVNDPATNAADGRIDLGELEGGTTDLETLLMVELTGGIEFHLPVSASFVGLTPGPDTTITISLTDIDDFQTLSVSIPAGVEPLSGFVNLDAATLALRLLQVKDWLGKVSNSAEFSIDLPFMDTSLGEVVDFSEAFEATVLYNLEFDDMESLQDFIAQLNRSGLLQEGESVTYDPVSHAVTIPLEFELDLGSLSLRDLDTLGLLDVQLLEDEGLIQIGPYVDPDDLLDTQPLDMLSDSYVSLGHLAAAGVLDTDSVADWKVVDEDTLAQAGIIGPAALAALDLIGTGNLVDLDELIDAGLVTFGELAEAEIVTPGSLVANLGFIRELNLAATNVADLAIDLASQASVEDLVDLDGLLASGIDTAENLLEELFDTGLLDLGDILLDGLNVDDIISSGIGSLQELVDQGLVTAGDFLSTTLVDISDLVSATGATLSDLVSEGLIDATDFVSSTLIDTTDFFTQGIATLADLLDEGLVAIDDFVDLALPAAGLIADGLASGFELDFHDLVDGIGNVSLHELVNSGVVTLEELIDNGHVAWTDLVGTYGLRLSDLLTSGITDIASLVSGTLVEANDLANGYVDNLSGLVRTGLVSLSDLVGNTLIDLTDLGLDELDIIGLIESGLADLGDLARESLIGPAQMAVDDLLASEVATQASSLFSQITSAGGLIGPGSIIDLDELLENLPVKLHHLIYFGIIDHNDVRPLGTVDADIITAANLIDASLLERHGALGVIDMGYLTLADLIDLGELVREDLADLPLADLDDFGLSASMIEELDDRGFIHHGAGIGIGDLLAETDVTMHDLLLSGLLTESDLVGDLANVLLDDVFVQGSLDRTALLESDLLELALLDGLISQNTEGRDVVAIADLISHNLATLADLVRAGLLKQEHFDLSSATLTENDLLASGLVPPHKLDDHALVQDGGLAPDFVAATDLLAFNVLTLAELVELSAPGEPPLLQGDLSLADLLESDILGSNVLQDRGLGNSGPVNLEAFLAEGLLTEDDLINAGLVDSGDFWDTSVVTLRQLVNEGLVTDAHLADNATVDLAVLLESDVVSEEYIIEQFPSHLYESPGDDDTEPDPRDSDTIPIEELLVDPYSPFAEMVKRGLLRVTAFTNKVFEQSVLESIMVLNDEMELVHLFEDGELDDIVHVGTVGLDTLLTSILYDVTLADYVEEDFVDIFDFDNIDLDVAGLEAEFAVDIDDTYVTTIPLYSLVALDYDEIDLFSLIEEGYLDADDLTDPALPLDIRDLETSRLFEVGDLNNYISAHQVFLYDLVQIVYIGDLVDEALLDENDLIIRNSGTSSELADLVEQGIVTRNSFDDIDLTAASLSSSGLVTTSDLNSFNLVQGGNVSLHDLINSGLVSLGQLVDAGLVDASDYAPSVTGVTFARINRSDIYDQALIEAYSLITGAEDDRVILTADSGDTLLNTSIATLAELVKAKVVTPAHLAADAEIDKDGLMDNDLAGFSELIDAGLIAAVDILPESSVLDLEALNDSGALPFTEVSGLDLMIALGLVTADEIDGLSTLAGSDLITAGLVSEDALVDNSLYGTHVGLVALLDSGLVTIDDLKDAGRDDRSGRVDLAGLLDNLSLSVTLTDLQTAGVVSSAVEIDELLDSGLVTLLDLVQGGVDKTALLATTFPGDVTISETQLVTAGLFDPAVSIAGLVDGGLASVSDLVTAALLDNEIDLEELILLNLVTGQQLVDGGIITQGQLDSESFVGPYLVSLLTTSVAFGDGTGSLVTVADLAASGFFSEDIDLTEILASGLVEAGELDQAGLLDVSINPRLLLASGLVTPEELAREGFITATLDKDDIVAAPTLGINEADLVEARLLMAMIDPQGLADAGLGVTLTDLENAGLITDPLISRGDLDDLPVVDYDVLDLVWLDIDRLLDSGLVAEDDSVDLDDLLDTVIPSIGAPLLNLADLARKGLLREHDLDGYNPKLFSLSGYTLSLNSDYGLGLVVKPAEFKPGEFKPAEFKLLAAGAFDLIMDVDGEPEGPTWSVRDFTLTATISYEVIDLDVPARLGFIGVTLANVMGADNLVRVNLTRTVILDEDGDLGTTDDRQFTFDQILAQDFDHIVSVELSGEATAELGGITVNTGLGGLNVAQGAKIIFEVEDFTRPRSDSDYITLTMEDVPGMFRVYEYLRLDDLMSTLLRGRDYVLTALDELPFFVTDPNSPLYEALSNVTIPVINKTPAELLQFLGTINDAVDRVQRALLDPDNDLQKLIEFIMDKLGLEFETESEIFSVTIEAGVLVMTLKLDEEYNEDIPFDFDLAGFAGLVGGIPGLEGIDDLIALEGSGTISVKAFAEIRIKAGIDASGRSGDLPVDIFLFDWDESLQDGTRVAAGFKLLARDISLGFEVFDSISLHTNDAGLDYDRDGLGGLDGELYTIDATIDGDGDATTNPELIDPNDRSDFVTVSFVLDQAGTEVPDDGKYRFTETLLGENVQFTGVDGGLELFMPLTVDIFGAVTDLSTPLWIRTNPYYDTDHNEGLEQIFLHLFGLEGAGPEDPVLIDAPNITDIVGELANSVIRTLLEQVAGLIGDLKDQFINTGFLDLEIPGTGRTIDSFFERDVVDNGLADVPTAPGLEAFLDIDSYIFDYLDEIVWAGPTSVASGDITPTDIWNGLVTFLNDHWVITLPGVGSTTGFITSSIVADVLTININPSYTINETFPLDFGTDLGDFGLELVGTANVDLALDTGISLQAVLDLSGEESTFTFNEFFFDAAVSTTGIDVGLSYQDFDISTNSSGTAELNLGGSIYLDSGSFTFDHEHNKGHTESYENSISVYLPFWVEGLELGSLSFADSDFYDGALDPGFDVDLQNIGDILESAAILIMDWLGETIDDVRGDLVPIYDTDGSVISAGYDPLVQSIPGTDISVNNVLGLENLLSVGKYIRHYLRPNPSVFGADGGFERDLSIPLGDGTGEGGENYHGPDGPTLGGFFRYMEANWIPTLGGGAGGFSWEPIMDGEDIVGIDLVFEQDLTYDRQFSLNFGEEVEAVDLEIDGQVIIDLEVAIQLAMNLSFNWDTSAVDFDITQLDFSGHASADDIVVGASIGPLSVSLGSKDCEKGRLSLDLGASASYIDGVVSFTPTANTATETNNYIDILVPIYASLGNVTFGSCSDPPRLMLSGTIFPAAGGPELSFSHENMDQLLDFSNFNLGSLIAVIQSTLDWLSGLTDLEFMTYELPVIDMEVGELFDVASAFADKVQSRIDFEQINSVQDFIEQFTEAGILPPGLDVVYDAATSSLTLPVNFDFNFNDLDLRNLANLGDIDYQQLLDLGAINPAELFDKDTILSGLLDMFATPLDQLARFDLIDIDSFNPATTLAIADLEALELIEPGALGTGSISLADLLNSDLVNVNLQELFNTDLLSATDLAVGGMIDLDELIASRLVSLNDLVEMGLTLFGLDTSALLDIADLETAGIIDPGALDSLGVTQISLGDLLDSDLVNVDVHDLMAAELISEVVESVEQPSQADFVDLAELLTHHAHSLADAMEMGLVSASEFNPLTSLSLEAIEQAGLIEVDELGDGTILLGDLLNSTEVSVTVLDLVNGGLLNDTNLGSFAPTTLLSIADLESYGIIPAGALDSLGVTDISLEDLLDSDLVDVEVMDLVPDGLLDGGDIIAGLGDVLGSSLMFEGFDLYDLVDMGMLSQSDIVSYSYDLLNIKDRPIDLSLDVGDVLELGFNTTATVLVTVEAGFEWVIDFDGPTGDDVSPGIVAAVVLI